MTWKKKSVESLTETYMVSVKPFPPAEIRRLDQHRLRVNDAIINQGETIESGSCEIRNEGDGVISWRALQDDAPVYEFILKVKVSTTHYTDDRASALEYLTDRIRDMENVTDVTDVGELT